MKKNILLPFTLVFAFAALSAAMAHRADTWKGRLTEVYQGALLSSLQQMEDMGYQLHKALLTQDSQAENTYLSLAAQGAMQVQKSLSLLPLSHPDTLQAMKLTNQLGDYAGRLMEREMLSEQDVQQLSALIDTCKAYTETLYQNREKLSFAPDQPPAFYPSEQTEAMDSDIAYPTLLYDGPFSDAAQQQKPLPLAGEREIDWEEAARIARQYVGENRVLSVSHGADVLGPTPCHGVTLHLRDITLEAAITRQGGKVLWLTPDNGAFPMEMTIEECRNAALQFLQSRRYGDMESTDFQVYEGVAVISFAPRQGNVLLYPDLVKVQLRMDTAEVVGVEAGHYLMNHRMRSTLAPHLSLQQAQAQVSARLSVQSAQLCLIPKNEREILCYEFTCTYQGDRFLLYINATDGTQEDILQVVETSTGLSTL